MRGRSVFVSAMFFSSPANQQILKIRPLDFLPSLQSQDSSQSRVFGAPAFSPLVSSKELVSHDLSCPFENIQQLHLHEGGDDKSLDTHTHTKKPHDHIVISLPTEDDTFESSESRDNAHPPSRKSQT